MHIYYQWVAGAYSHAAAQKAKEMLQKNNEV